MIRIIATALLLLIAPLFAVTLQWNANTEPDLAGYRIHWGPVSGQPDQHRDVGNVTTATIDNSTLPFNTLVYFTTTAYNSIGLESPPSNAVTFLLVPVAPTPTPTPAPSPIPQAFRMDVVNGGIHLMPGTTVLLSADDPPPGMLFKEWTGDIIILSSPFETPTTATMFSMDVEVAAAYATPTSPPTPAPAPVVSIWASTAPGNADGGADSSVELGVKFRSDVNGIILGIRFYKHALNTGTHTGRLWTSVGAQLAAVTFTGESASGWQEARFLQPVAITANTIYVASYHANNGHYSADTGYFANSGRDTPPLHAVQNGSVYRYGTGAQFPNLTWQSSNYWVDVLFQQN